MTAFTRMQQPDKALEVFDTMVDRGLSLCAHWCPACVPIWVWMDVHNVCKDCDWQTPQVRGVAMHWNVAGVLPAVETFLLAMQTMASHDDFPWFLISACNQTW